MRAAVFSLLILGTPAIQAADDKDNFPLAVGTQWTYKLGDKGDKFVITTLKSAKVGAQDCVVFEAKLNGKFAASEHVAVLKDGVYRFMYGEKSFEPPICFFKPSAKKGDSWQQEYKIGDTKGTIKFAVDVQDVEVPAGKFKDVLVVNVEATEMDSISKTTVYYAKNHGMVKQIIIDGDKPIVLELEKMEVPKK